MKVSLTLFFLFMWTNEMALRIQNGEENFWLFIEGITVILCGIYWSLQDLKDERQ